MARRPKLADDQLAEMARLRARNWSTARIAAFFTEAGTPITDRTIEYQCKALGVDVAPRFRNARHRRPPVMHRGDQLVRSFTPAEDEQLLQLASRGMSAAEIGRRLGRHQSVVSRRRLALAHWAARDAAAPPGNDR